MSFEFRDPVTYCYDKVYLLVDCNNFFCSCERLFRPDLEGRPLLVLSNNDGCVIARSQEAKDLGIPMGIAVFKIKNLIRRHHIVTFSSNFSLYLDISRRVMEVLEHLCDDTQVYSVDEAFLCFKHISEKEALDKAILVRNAVFNLIGINVGVGIAHTKTLAKLANHHAKKHRQETYGLYSILQDMPRINLLKNNPISEVWGIGRRLNERLNEQGIHTAYQLSVQNYDAIKKEYNIVLMRTVQELNDLDVIEDESDINHTMQIMWSRSFTKRLTTLDELHQALANFVASACHKLRNQNKYCSQITVFIRTSYFGNDPKFAADKTANLKVPTSDTREVLYVATQLLKMIFAPGYKYNKAGIILGNLTATRSFQSDLFTKAKTPQEQEKSDQLMKAIDQINHQGHEQNIFIASQGPQKAEAFSNKNSLSPSYTTSWDDLPKLI